jgi:hypothetical protein
MWRRRPVAFVRPTVNNRVGDTLTMVQILPRFEGL